MDSNIYGWVSHTVAMVGSAIKRGHGWFGYIVAVLTLGIDPTTYDIITNVTVHLVQNRKQLRRRK